MVNPSSKLLGALDGRNRIFQLLTFSFFGDKVHQRTENEDHH